MVLSSHHGVAEAGSLSNGRHGWTTEDASVTDRASLPGYQRLQTSNGVCRNGRKRYGQKSRNVRKNARSGSTNVKKLRFFLL